MAKSTKKSTATPKAAAKPRKPAAKKTVAPKIDDSPPGSLPRKVAELAHRFWNERGRAHGRDADDWFRAEELLRGKAS